MIQTYPTKFLFRENQDCSEVHISAATEENETELQRVIDAIKALGGTVEMDGSAIESTFAGTIIAQHSHGIREQIRKIPGVEFVGPLTPQVSH